MRTPRLSETSSHTDHAPATAKYQMLSRQPSISFWVYCLQEIPLLMSPPGFVFRSFVPDEGVVIHGATVDLGSPFRPCNADFLVAVQGSFPSRIVQIGRAHV